MKFTLRILATLLFCAAPALALERPAHDSNLPATTIEGTVQALYADDFDGGHSELLYHLVTDDGTRLPLSFSETAPSYRTGERLRLTGRTSDGGLFEVERAEPAFGPAPESAGAPFSPFTIGAKRVLLIRYNFANDTSQPYSDAAAQAVMFASSGSTAAFYAEGSYGLTTHTGNITPWLTVSTNKPTTCDISSYSQANSLASAAGYNLGTYNYLVYVFPHIPCGWAGLGVVGGSGAWINQALSTYVVSHEVGHNYGLWHSHSWDCGATPIGPTCTRSEYGDPFDTMGGALRQFNAYSKASELGWLTGGSVATRSSGSATYTLMPLESGSGLRALQLPTTVAGRTYWVEFRQAIGFDSGLSSNVNVMNGALIHLGPSAVGGSDLLDMTPATSTFGDAALDVGNAFTDPAAGLTITAVSKSGSTLNVRVDFATAVPAANFSFSPISPLTGQTVTFVDASSNTPTSWNWNFGDSATSTLQNPTHVYTAAGTFTVSLTASNAAGTSAVFSRLITVTLPPVPTVTSLVASPALPRPTGTTITWTATATGGIAPLQYRFLRYSYTTATWTIVRAYSTSNTYIWTPAASEAGTYQLEVWVKNAGSLASWDAYKTSPAFTITPATSALTVTSLNASPALPQPVGTTITWTVSTTGGTAPLQYKFLRYSYTTATWTIVRAYSTNNTYIWTPAASEAGTYQLEVWVKNAGSLASWDAYKTSPGFTITPVSSTLTVTSLNASLPLPQPVGTTITWTVSTTGGTAPLQYKFLRYSYTTATWTVVQAYSTGSTYTWTPSASEAGTYQLEVWVKNAGSLASWDAYKTSPGFTITP